MTLSLEWAVAWLIAAAIVAFLVTLWDKNRARRREWRVQESTLWLIALLGGSAVMFLTMLVIRHKTRRTKFMVAMPLLKKVFFLRQLIDGQFHRTHRTCRLPA